MHMYLIVSCEKIKQLNLNLNCNFKKIVPILVEFLAIKAFSQRLTFDLYNVMLLKHSRVSNQGTTLRASDFHNARATILNTFIQLP